MANKHVRKQKKILLFIVEGETDSNALAAIIEKVFSPHHIKTILMHGDFTSKYLNRDTNIQIHLTNFVKKNVLAVYPYYTAKDFADICMLIDLDGCFVKDSQIVEKDVEKNQYDREYIYAKNVEKQINTKNHKAKNLRILSAKKNVKVERKAIPFSCCYMSCNLEDVFYGKQNNTDEEKGKLADKIVDYYEGNVEEFIRFLEKQYLADSEYDYVQSWKYPQIGNHSLHRHTNFLLFLLRNEQYLSEEARKVCLEFMAKDEESIE